MLALNTAAIPRKSDKPFMFNDMPKGKRNRPKSGEIPKFSSAVFKVTGKVTALLALEKASMMGLVIRLKNCNGRKTHDKLCESHHNTGKRSNKLNNRFCRFSR